MKFGKSQKLEESNITFTSSETPISGKEAVNIIDPDSLNTYAVVEGAANLIIDLTTPLAMAFIGLFNVTIETDITIDIYTTFPGTPSQSKTITAAQLRGLEYLSTFMEIADTASTISAIVLTWTGGTPTFQTSIGTIWTGDIVDLDCVESIIYNEISADDAGVSRANVPDAQRRYNYREIKFTTPKETIFETHREKMRFLLSTGVGTPRPWLIESSKEGFIDADEVIYSIMDSSKIPLGPIEADGGVFFGQSTIGFREIF